MMSSVLQVVLVFAGIVRDAFALRLGGALLR
jgi:hypothetical protein